MRVSWRMAVMVADQLARDAITGLIDQMTKDKAILHAEGNLLPAGFSPARWPTQALPELGGQRPASEYFVALRQLYLQVEPFGIEPQ